MQRVHVTARLLLPSEAITYWLPMQICVAAPDAGQPGEWNGSFTCPPHNALFKVFAHELTVELRNRQTARAMITWMHGYETVRRKATRVDVHFLGFGRPHPYVLHQILARAHD